VHVIVVVVVVDVVVVVVVVLVLPASGAQSSRASFGCTVRLPN
jgi:hypothetical protein